MNWHETVGTAWLATDEVRRAFTIVRDESSKRKLPKPIGGAGQHIDLSATDHYDDDIQEIPVQGFQPGCSKVKIEKVDPPASAVETIRDSDEDSKERTPVQKRQKGSKVASSQVMSIVRKLRPSTVSPGLGLDAHHGPKDKVTLKSISKVKTPAKAKGRAGAKRQLK
ncbi:unnamed protein product [Calypogeia fissa]